MAAKARHSRRKKRFNNTLTWGLHTTGIATHRRQDMIKHDCIQIDNRCLLVLANNQHHLSVPNAVCRATAH